MMWSQLGLTGDMKVLDLGSGPGVVSCELARTAHSGTVVGVDVNEMFVQLARRVQATEGVSNLCFVQGNAYDLPFEADTFNFIYSRFLFQHLSEPVRALREALRVLKPNGILCVADVDDGWLLLHPEPPEFAKFVMRAQASQAALGGDRRVGRKLGGLFVEAGFEEVRPGVLPITTREIGMSRFLDIVTGFKHELIKTSCDAEMARELKAIHLAVEGSPDAWGAVGVFYARGRKPSRPSAFER